MTNLLFGDLDTRAALLPLTYTRPTALLRCGIHTLEEKWKHFFSLEHSYLTVSYLEEKFPAYIKEDNLLINPLFMPSSDLAAEIENLKPNSWLMKDAQWVAARLGEDDLKAWKNSELKNGTQIKSLHANTPIQFPWHLFQQNKVEIKADYDRLPTKKSFSFHESVRTIGTDIYVEEGAQIINCSLNSLDGPIYIGKNAVIQDGAIIKGPFALCEGATVNMGAKIRDATTVGPHSKVGGEINNSILIGYSNKGHDGFLGNSVLGEWCNLGADTNTSNLKNNYSEVAVYSIEKNKNASTGSQFCGLIMGDHSKSGINTMFNTGTVVGVSANIYGGDFPPKYIPSFSWGGAAGFDLFHLDKAEEVAARVMSRRKKDFDQKEKKVFTHLYNERKKELKND